MINSLWTSNILFLGLSDEQLKIIEPHIHDKKYAPNEVIIEEGDSGSFMFLIDEGSVSVNKNELTLTTRVAGDLVGLMSLIDLGPRSATVVAGDRGAAGFVISKSGLEEIIDREKDSIVSTMFMNYIKYQQNAIRNTNALSLQEARAKFEQEQKRIVSARFFVQMVLVLIVFMIVLGILKERSFIEGATNFQLFQLVFFGLWSFFFAQKSNLPNSFFGLTKANFYSAFKSVMGASVIFLMVIVAFKWAMITWFPDLFGNNLIELYTVDEGGQTMFIFILIGYVLYFILQEFIARACIQGSLLRFIIGKQSAWTAIISTALIFSSFHLLGNLKVAILSFLPGIFWGYFYYKGKNIFAVIVSHIVIGLVSVFLLNLPG